MRLDDVAVVAQLQAAAEPAPAAAHRHDLALDYWPRSALSVGPSPQQPIAIDFPSFAGEAAQYAGEFDVFVDESGGVVRVVSVDSELPPILVQAVRDAFLSARFSPGELDGKPVRSRMRIEVTFDSRTANMY